MQLAPELTQALNALMEGVSRKDLAREAQKMSAGYRAGTGSQAIATPLQAMAYAVARMPATYAACAAVFEAQTGRARLRAGQPAGRGRGYRRRQLGGGRRLAHHRRRRHAGPQSGLA